MGFLNLEGLRYLTAQLKTLFATKTYVDEKFENSGTVKSVANIGPMGVETSLLLLKISKQYPTQQPW